MNNLSREEQIALIYDKWQKMTITSDPMFGLVMQNKEICLELINRALPNIKAKQIIQLDTQKDINIVSAHRVRFDVYVRDDKNNIIVIEMQVNNQNNIPARLRYYQEQVEHELLRPGDNYSVLNNYPTYIIMFCNFDYFKQGWARYEFNLTCTRDHNLKFGDNRTVVIFNALAKKFDKNEQKKILDVGTGGGFPSVILAIALSQIPEIKIIANDSRIKKINFIKNVTVQLIRRNQSTFFKG